MKIITNLPGPDEVTVSVSYLDALIAQLEAAEQALIKPLPIGELIHRLEGQTYRKWYDDDEPDKMRERAEAAEARLLVPVKLPDGWRLAPIKPTKAMIDAFKMAYEKDESYAEHWIRMLAAAPNYPVEGGE